MSVLQRNITYGKGNLNFHFTRSLDHFPISQPEKKVYPDGLKKAKNVFSSCRQQAQTIHFRRDLMVCTKLNKLDDDFSAS